MIDVTVQFRPEMYAVADQFTDDVKFIAAKICLGEGNEVKFYVDPPDVGRFMDMLQGLLNAIDAMPCFDDAKQPPAEPDDTEVPF